MPISLWSALVSAAALGAAALVGCSSTGGGVASPDASVDETGSAEGKGAAPGSECRNNVECASPGVCQYGFQYTGGGGAAPPRCPDEADDCKTDAECTPTRVDAGATDSGPSPDLGAPRICLAKPGTCSVRRCVEGCTSDTACGPAEKCDLAMHRCGTRPCANDAECGPGTASDPVACNLATGLCRIVRCSKDADCGANATCSDRQCLPKTCTKDDECAGACVNRVCAAGPGKCAELAQ
jgi:hypothetical protein